MTYCFVLDETPQAGVRRIALEQIDRAMRQLHGGESAEAVHEARKCFKRLRALLKLARPCLAKSTYRRENRCIRDIARSLSITRDFDVMPRTLTYLIARYPDMPKSTLSATTKAIDLGRSDVDSRDRGEIVGEAVRELGAARHRLSQLKLRHNDFAQITVGAGHCLAALEEEFTQARTSRQDEDWHDWRKTVQLHWRQMRLLSQAWPELLEARISVTRRLAAALGLDHDISVLAAFVEASSQRTSGKPVLPKNARAALLAGCREEQHRLRRQADGFGQLLAVDSPTAFAERIASYREAQLAIAANTDSLDLPVD